MNGAIASFMRVRTIAIDLIACAALIVPIAIVSGVSGTFYLGPWLVSVTSARNPIVILVCALVVRSFDADTPFLGFVAVSRLPRHALRVMHRLHDGLSALTLNRATLILIGVLAASFALKVMLAARHPGFWTGDDVEIHEMTFARLFGYQWRANGFRSPFYPFAFIYPIQALLVRLGYVDPGQLVIAGRAVVAAATVATLCLTFHVGRSVFASIPIAVISVLILATNKLHVMTGTTELPRPVASLFVLLAFGLLTTSRRDSAACAAGAAIAAATAMRFSEEIFLLPAVLQLCAAGRWRGVMMLALGFGAVATAALGAIDILYWGEPFFSVRHIVDITLVHRLSTRGFQPWYEYVRTIPSWTNIAVAALVVYTTIARRLWTLGIWTWSPVVVLSLLPHKEPRYLVPILPYFSMIAAMGLWQTIVWLRQSTGSTDPQRRQRMALPLVMVVAAILVTEPMDYVLPRTDEGITIARHIALNGPADGVLAESAWNIGGRIYLPRATPLIDIDFALLSDRVRMEELIHTPAVTWLVLQDRDVRRLGYDSLIAEGFDSIAVPRLDSGAYRVYHRRRSNRLEP
jgi:hypothetical protein